MTLIEVGDKVKQDRHSVIHEVKSVIRSQGSFSSIIETCCGKTGYASAFDLMSYDKGKVETTCIRCKEQEHNRREGGA